MRLTTIALIILSLGTGWQVLASAADKESSPEKQGNPRKGAYWGVLPIFSYSSDYGVTAGGTVQRIDYAEGALPYRTLSKLSTFVAPKGESGFLYRFRALPKSQWVDRVQLWVTGLHNEIEPYYDDQSRLSLVRTTDLDVYSTVRLNVWNRLDFESGLLLTAIRAQENEGESFRDSSFADELWRYSTALHLGAVWEGRDNELVPTRGFFARTRVLSSPTWLSYRTGSWHRGDLWLRGFVPVIRNAWLWFASELRVSASTRNTPFQWQSRLGGYETQRGIPKNRFFTPWSATLRLAVRSFFWRFKVYGAPFRIGGAGFTEMGQRGQNFSGLFRGETVPSGGISILWTAFADDLAGSFDFAGSRYGTAAYARLGLAF